MPCLVRLRLSILTFQMRNYALEKKNSSYQSKSITFVVKNI